MLKRDFALRGSIYLPPEVRPVQNLTGNGEVLTLKFQEGLTDKAIAERMAVAIAQFVTGSDSRMLWAFMINLIKIYGFRLRLKRER